MSIFTKRKVYLDHASTTPLDKDVLSAMSPYFKDNFYNPSSIYNEGRETSSSVENSRKIVARYISCKPDNIIFTGSGTESDNMAILGVYEAYKGKLVPHFISSTIEHPAILESLKEVERRGAEVSYIQPEENGIVSIEKVEKEIKENTILISII
jgi:cysteine desulfurase